MSKKTSYIVKKSFTGNRTIHDAFVALIVKEAIDADMNLHLQLSQSNIAIEEKTEYNEDNSNRSSSLPSVSKEG